MKMSEEQLHFNVKVLAADCACFSYKITNTHHKLDMFDQKRVLCT